jgi:hypothetical protein
MPIFGYHVIGHDNGGRLFPYALEDCPDKVVCKSCGTCKDYRYCPDEIELHRSSRYDVGATYDGRHLFSEAFVAHCEPLLGDADFLHPISGGGRRYFYFVPGRIVQFDAERRETRFENPCGACGGFEYAVGATPVHLLKREPLGPGFSRTDIAFGSHQGKFPLILVGEEGARRISQRKWRGLELEPVTL